MRDRTVIDEFLRDLEEENEWLHTQNSNLIIEINKLKAELEAVKKDYVELKRKNK